MTTRKFGIWNENRRQYHETVMFRVYAFTNQKLVRSILPSNKPTDITGTSEPIKILLKVKQYNQFLVPQSIVIKRKSDNVLEIQYLIRKFYPEKVFYQNLQ